MTTINAEEAPYCLTSHLPPACRNGEEKDGSHGMDAAVRKHAANPIQPPRRRKRRGKRRSEPKTTSKEPINFEGRGAAKFDRHSQKKKWKQRDLFKNMASNASPSDWPPRRPKHAKKPTPFYLKKFDSTKGYPGEGPKKGKPEIEVCHKACEHGKPCIISGHYHRTRNPKSGFDKRNAEKNNNKRGDDKPPRPIRCKWKGSYQCQSTDPDHYHDVTQHLESEETLELIETHQAEQDRQSNWPHPWSQAGTVCTALAAAEWDIGWAPDREDSDDDEDPDLYADLGGDISDEQDLSGASLLPASAETPPSGNEDTSSYSETEEEFPNESDDEKGEESEADDEPWSAHFTVTHPQIDKHVEPDVDVKPQEGKCRDPDYESDPSDSDEEAEDESSDSDDELELEYCKVRIFFDADPEQAKKSFFFRMLQHFPGLKNDKIWKGMTCEKDGEPYRLDHAHHSNEAHAETAWTDKLRFFFQHEGRGVEVGRDKVACNWLQRYRLSQLVTIYPDLFKVLQTDADVTKRRVLARDGRMLDSIVHVIRRTIGNHPKYKLWSMEPGTVDKTIIYYINNHLISESFINTALVDAPIVDFRNAGLSSTGQKSAPFFAF